MKSLFSRLLMGAVINVIGVFLLVRFVISDNPSRLQDMMFDFAFLTMALVVISAILVIVFISRVIMKKNNSYINILVIALTCTIVMGASTYITGNEAYKVYNVLKMKWGIDIPRETKDLYYKDSGEYADGDGESFGILQYDSSKEVSNALSWGNLNDSTKNKIKAAIEELAINEEYIPNLEGELMSYSKVKESKSEMHLLLDKETSKVYYIGTSLKLGR